MAAESALEISPVHRHIHTPTAESTTQGDGQRIRSSQGEAQHYMFWRFFTPLNQKMSPDFVRVIWSLRVVSKLALDCSDIETSYLAQNSSLCVKKGCLLGNNLL